MCDTVSAYVAVPRIIKKTRPSGKIQEEYFTLGRNYLLRLRLVFNVPEWGEGITLTCIKVAPLG